jgi:sugar phosphate permease
MTKAYSIAFKQKMVQRLTEKNAVNPSQLGREIGIRQQNLSRWLHEARSLPSVTSNTPKSRVWTVEQKAQVLADASKLTGEELTSGIVLFLGALCFVVFLVEGAMLGWSAVFLSEIRGAPSAEAGFAYACFSVAMTLGRLTGDAIVKKLGPRVILAGGGSLAVLGIIPSTVVPSWQISLVGYALIGLGCSNIVPVLFSAAGRQKTMPQALAVPALTTLGYAGILAGPAGIGFIARQSSLAAAFLWLAALMVGVAISSLVLTGSPLQICGTSG